MNKAFGRVLAAPTDDRRRLFVDTARRLGLTEQYVGKDFWVRWALDAPVQRSSSRRAASVVQRRKLVLESLWTDIALLGRH